MVLAEKFDFSLPKGTHCGVGGSGHEFGVLGYIFPITKFVDIIATKGKSQGFGALLVIGVRVGLIKEDRGQSSVRGNRVSGSFGEDIPEWNKKVEKFLNVSQICTVPQESHFLIMETPLCMEKVELLPFALLAANDG